MYNIFFCFYRPAFSLYIFSIAISHCIALYIRYGKPDNAEHNKLLEESLPTTSWLSWNLQLTTSWSHQYLMRGGVRCSGKPIPKMNSFVVFDTDDDLIVLDQRTLDEGDRSRSSIRSRMSTPCYASLATASRFKRSASWHIDGSLTILLNPFISDLWLNCVAVRRLLSCYLWRIC